MTLEFRVESLEFNFILWWDNRTRFIVVGADLSTSATLLGFAHFP